MCSYVRGDKGGRRQLSGGHHVGHLDFRPCRHLLSHSTAVQHPGQQHRPPLFYVAQDCTSTGLVATRLHGVALTMAASAHELFMAGNERHWNREVDPASMCAGS